MPTHHLVPPLACLNKVSRRGKLQLNSKFGRLREGGVKSWIAVLLVAATSCSSGTVCNCPSNGCNKSCDQSSPATGEVLVGPPSLRCRAHRLTARVRPSTSPSRAGFWCRIPAREPATFACSSSMAAVTPRRFALAKSMARAAVTWVVTQPRSSPRMLGATRPCEQPGTSFTGVRGHR